MTLPDLLSKPEFWAALFGALTAFLLGVFGQWWTANSANRSNGNITLMALSQMYTELENLRHHVLVQEPLRAGRIRKLVGYKPLPFEIRPPVGIAAQRIRLRTESLGFLADSNDPDVLNRLLTIERAFNSLLELAARFERLHGEFGASLNLHDPTGQTGYSPESLIPIVGAKLLIELDDTVEGLKTGLPRCCADLLAITGQLRQTLRAQFPVRRFVGITTIPRSGIATPPLDLPKPALWRRATRATVDVLSAPLSWNGCAEPSAEPGASCEAASEETAPEIRRFPQRSYTE